MLTFSYLLMTLLMFSGLFLIGLILLQRGRGGGLAGAFGGMGGQSAFGTKAGDVFTRITIGVASAWILLCAGSVVALHHSSSGLRTNDTIFKKEDAGVDVKKAKAKEEESSDEAAAGDPKTKGVNAPAAATGKSSALPGLKSTTTPDAQDGKKAEEEQKPADPAAAPPANAVKPKDGEEAGKQPAEQKSPDAKPNEAEPAPKGDPK